MSVKLLGSPKNETDEVTYDKDGIKKWALWSEGVMDWVEIPPTLIKERYPKKFDDLEAELVEEELGSARRLFWNSWF